MDNILEVKNLKKYFATPKGLLHAVENVTFGVPGQTTMGIVGESGCGKSTLGRTIIGLLDPTDGQVIFEGKKISGLRGAEKKELCRKMQIIFQDPFSCLDPRMNIKDLIAEPLDVNHSYRSRAERNARVEELMDTVGLAQRFINSYPHELDGGRRQRIGIARALALNPDFIVCDEPVSALDVSIQAQILNLLQDLQEEMGLTYLFITHNLSVVKHISDEIIVMYLGCIVEKAAKKDLYSNPVHPYTKALLSAIPIPSVKKKKDRILLKGEISSPINPKLGCRFAPRCPNAEPECFQIAPDLQEIEPGHFVACHHM